MDKQPRLRSVVAQANDFGSRVTQQINYPSSFSLLT